MIPGVFIMLNLTLSKLLPGLFTTKPAIQETSTSPPIQHAAPLPPEETLTEREQQLRLQYERIAQRQGILDAEDEANQRWRSR